MKCDYLTGYFCLLNKDHFVIVPLKNGFTIKPAFVPTDTIEAIKTELSTLPESMPAHGLRNAEKKLATVMSLAQSNQLLSLAECYLSGKPSLVRAIVFDKTPEKNWLVTWHQDKTISVNNKVDIDGWGPWSLKDNCHHVQPDISVLDDMITLRVHLDDSSIDNGCLKVIGGSHNMGVLNQQQIDELSSQAHATTCHAYSGDVLVMRPLLLHASSKGKLPSRRRIVHLEYSAFELPKGLSWA